ncbi:MAG TPA: hypothetical protein VJW20_15760 [Candidatus Angelobacter sp.]|nr:hypothetical protein [Candidatus Angelobacter sp.]
MRRAATAMLLATVFTALSSACVAGLGSGTAISCGEALPKPRECSRPVRNVKAADCRTIISAAKARCGLRTFVQITAVQAVTVSLSAPQPQSAEAVRPGDAVIIVSSVGPSETDRGPPCS